MHGLGILTEMDCRCLSIIPLQPKWEDKVVMKMMRG